MYHLKTMYKYHQQIHLRKTRDHRRSWATIDDQLWLQFVAIGGHSVAQNTSRMSYTVNRPWYDSNFKNYCTRINCIYNHTCIRFGKCHPSVYCQLSFNTFRNPGGYTERPPNIAHRYSPNMRMESPSVQLAYHIPYAPRARQNFDFRFRPNIARFPGQQLSLHKMQN
jgi:hypothetical protein